LNAAYREKKFKKSSCSFGHRFMIMGGWGRSLYPGDASMRGRNGAARGQADVPGEVQLQEYRGWSRGARDRGKAEALQRDRTLTARGQRGPRGRHRGHGIRPAQSGSPRGPPSNRGCPALSGPPPSHSNAARPQPVGGQPCLDPRGLPGLIQFTGLMDAMQRLALMMAVMILGAPQVYSCNIGAGSRAEWRLPPARRLPGPGC
jgi:hypothetical protein